jgi:phosphonate transport system substrate-binding protein
MKRMLIVALLMVSGCTSNSLKNEIVMGFNPAESADVVETKAKDLAKIIDEKTGLKLKTFIATDYGALVESMRSGRVHFGFLPPFSLIQAEKVAGAKVLLKAVRRGHGVYYSAIITAKDYKSVKDLKGKTIAWVDPASTTGHIMAKNMLMDQGIEPDTFFSKQVFAGGHDALVLAVLNKTVDAGATFVNDPEGTDGSWLQYMKNDADKKKIKVLMVSPPIPGDTLATTEKFMAEHKDVVEKVVQIMRDLSKTPEGRKILMDLYHIESMEDATAVEYQTLRDAAKRLNINQ